MDGVSSVGLNHMSGLVSFNSNLQEQVLKALRLEFSDYKVLAQPRTSGQSFNIAVFDYKGNTIATCNKVDKGFAVVNASVGPDKRLSLK